MCCSEVAVVRDLGPFGSDSLGVGPQQESVGRTKIETHVVDFKEGQFIR